jgi:hypothetical protein
MSLPCSLSCVGRLHVEVMGIFSGLSLLPMQGVGWTASGRVHVAATATAVVASVISNAQLYSPLQRSACTVKHRLNVQAYCSTVALHVLQPKPLERQARTPPPFATCMHGQNPQPGLYSGDMIS